MGRTGHARGCGTYPEEDQASEDGDHYVGAPHFVSRSGSRLTGYCRGYSSRWMTAASGGPPVRIERNCAVERSRVLYRSKMTMGEQMASSTPEEMKAGMDAWMAWGAAAGDALVDWGVPTMPTSQDNPGPAGWIGGYSIVQGESAWVQRSWPGTRTTRWAPSRSCRCCPCPAPDGARTIGGAEVQSRTPAEDTHGCSPCPSPLLPVAQCVWVSLGVTKPVDRQQVLKADPCVGAVSSCVGPGFKSPRRPHMKVSALQRLLGRLLLLACCRN